jgi:hypothetical protein
VFDSRLSRDALGIILGCLLGSLLIAPGASGSPVTVNLRVEGSAATLYEGPVSTGPEVLETSSSHGAHPCNFADNGLAGAAFSNGGNPAGTPTTALHDAARQVGLAFDAEWFGSGKEKNENPGDFFVSRVGTDVNQTSSPFDSWGYAVNFTTAPVGGCQIALAPGSEVLWAYNYFNLPHLLRLSGASSVNTGTPFSLQVSDGQTGEPISGASIGQVLDGVTTPINATTDANGNVTITLSRAGVVALKATRTDSVRSNGLAVCVHNGNDGTCGTVPSSGVVPPPSSGSPTTADLATVSGVKNGHVYRRRFAPRVLGGIVEVPAGGTLRDVRIRLERRYQGRCFDFSGTREAFRRARRCGTASFFSVGDSQSFTYLLPSRLAVGRYVYDVEALDNLGKTSKLVPGVSHVVFRVR